MASQVQTLLQNARKAEIQLQESLDGADYCLDWKSDSSDWSLREVVYHLLSGPGDGLPMMINGIMSGGLKEHDLWAGGGSREAVVAGMRVGVDQTMAKQHVQESSEQRQSLIRA